MTPRLQQALKLLQVPTLELQQILKQEIMQNPLLEEVDECPRARTSQRRTRPTRRTTRRPPIRRGGRDRLVGVHAGRRFDRAYVPQGETRSEFLEKVQVTRTTLAESLLEQIHFLD
jgi:DNA-directed RNA polymerase specialized sigma54-like protein